jgi:hypothetical protein
MLHSFCLFHSQVKQRRRKKIGGKEQKVIFGRWKGSERVKTKFFIKTQAEKKEGKKERKKEK